MIGAQTLVSLLAPVGWCLIWLISLVNQVSVNGEVSADFVSLQLVGRRTRDYDALVRIAKSNRHRTRLKLGIAALNFLAGLTALFLGVSPLRAVLVAGLISTAGFLFLLLSYHDRGMYRVTSAGRIRRYTDVTEITEPEKRDERKYMRLGKKAAVHDPRTLKLNHYLLRQRLPELPPSVDYSEGITDWGMLKNNELGDCTCAGIAHMFRVWDAQTKGPERATDDDVVELYSRVTQPPFDPKTRANDDGAVELFVLREVRRNGLHASSASGQDLMKILAFVSVDHNDETQVKQALFLFGGLYLGVALPISASQQQGAGQPWDDTGEAGPNAQPGSWGGHAVNLTGYNDATKMYDFITWGKKQQMTYAFFKRYVEEAWALVPDDYQKLTQGQALENGFNFDQLTEDLKQFGQVNQDA